MEAIEEWGDKPRVAPNPASKETPPASDKEICESLRAFKPDVLSVHCYEDVGHPWVQVVFADLIDPDIALRVGAALATKAGAHRVYFNSLRPKAVYFLLEPAFAPQPDLQASRYGAPLAEIQACWQRTGKRSLGPSPRTRIRFAHEKPG
jgi:hypothetical protein